jgi:ribosomal protein L28
MKYRIETAKPNIARKKLYSDALGIYLNLWISMKTRKCIMKCGNLDNYLLTTKPKYLDSKMGLHLRSLVKSKLARPDTFKLEYIPGRATLPRTRKTKVWEYKQIPAVYTPAHVRQVVDFSEFYEKPPSEMSRYELQELEKAMREEMEEMEDGGEKVYEEEEVTLDEDGNPVDKAELYRKTDEFLAT